MAQGGLALGGCSCWLSTRKRRGGGVEARRGWLEEGGGLGDRRGGARWWSD